MCGSAFPAQMCYLMAKEIRSNLLNSIDFYVNPCHVNPNGPPMGPWTRVAGMGRWAGWAAGRANSGVSMATSRIGLELKDPQILDLAFESWTLDGQIFDFDNQILGLLSKSRF